MNPYSQYTMPPKRRSPWRFIFLLLLLGIGFAIGLRLVAGRPTANVMGPRPIMPAVRVPRLPPRPDEGRISEAATSDSQASDVLLADVYPSRQSAIAALASRVPGAIAQVAADPGEIHLLVHGTESDARPIANSIIQSFPAAHVSQMTDLDRGISWSNDGIGITVKIDEPSADTRKNSHRGGVQIQVVGPTQSSVLFTGFVNLPWAQEFSEFTNQHPGHTYVVATTRKPAPSLVEASRDAEARAADELLQLVWQRTGGGVMETSPNIPAQILRDIRRSLPVSQRFTQRFDRPYGTIWTQSILLDPSSNWIASMAGRHTVLVQQRQVRVKTTAASAAIVLVTIILAYLFLNAVTKSYFTGRLRTIAIVFALVAVVVAAGVISAA